MDLIGDLGGVHDLFVVFISLFMSSISEHFFIFKVIGKLYLIKTAKTNLFNHPKQLLKKKTKKLKFKNTKIEIPDSLYNKEIVSNVNMHYPIRFSTWTKIKLFIIPKCLKTDKHKH